MLDTLKLFQSIPDIGPKDQMMMLEAELDAQTANQPTTAKTKTSSFQQDIQRF